MTSTTLSTKQSTASSLPPRKRARTEAEKEQRRIERIIRNRKAAHASREKKRKHVEQLESYVKALEENLSSMYENQSLILQHLKSLDPTIDLPLVEKISKPDDLIFEDEETSDSNRSSKKQKLKEVELENIEHSLKQNEEYTEMEQVDVKEQTLSPLFSTVSSPTISNSDLSNPTTPNIDYSSSYLYTSDYKPGTDDLDLNNYLDSESSNPGLVEFDVDNILKSNESNDMGFLGMFNSVHSAVMHIF